MTPKIQLQFALSILTIGTEVAEGQITDTNSIYLSHYFWEHFGLQTLCKMAVRDQKQEIISALNYLSGLTQIVICTGGLGPTVDDITLESAAEFLNEDLEISEEYRQKLSSLFLKKGREVRPEHLKMVQLIKNSFILPNNVGIAIGGIYKNQTHNYFVFFPGVPSEMRGMVEGPFTEWLQKQKPLLPQTNLEFFSFRVFNFVESDVDQKLRENDFYDFEILDKAGHVFVRIPINQSPHYYQLNPTKNKIEQTFGLSILPEIFPTIQDYAIHLLKLKKFKLTCAESCTGGTLSARLLSVPGASDVIETNIITYSNLAKQSLLQVNNQTLSKNGAVSAEVAYEMAQGALKLQSADISISITGIAGPGGGTEEKPVGTVFIALANRQQNNTQIKRFFYPTTREEFCKKVSQVSLQWLLTHLLHN